MMNMMPAMKRICSKGAGGGRREERQVHDEFSIFVP